MNLVLQMTRAKQPDHERNEKLYNRRKYISKWASFTFPKLIPVILFVRRNSTGGTSSQTPVEIL